MDKQYAIKRLFKSEKFHEREIKFLRELEFDREVFDAIIFALTHAYDGALTSSDTDTLSSAPLWFTIVAEEDKYLKEDLINPVINLYLVENDWDYLNEQGQYLVGKLAQKFPDLMAERIRRTIDFVVKYLPEQNYPYLFLFDAFYSADIAKYKDWLLQIVQSPKMIWQEPLVADIADWQIKEAIPIFRNMLKVCPKNEPVWSLENNLKQAIEQLETGEIKYPKFAQHYFKQRTDWQEHYKDFNSRNKE